MLKAWIIAARPWSFTASIVPVITAISVLTNTTLAADMAFNGDCRPDALQIYLLLVATVCVHAAANLTNTYSDWASGADNPKSGTSDRTIVDGHLSASTVLRLSWWCYGVSGAAFLTLSQRCELDRSSMGWICVLGFLLAYFYTAWPFRLKYHALGDIVIFLCFGPLLMQTCALAVTGFTQTCLWPFSITIGVLTEAILHANNTRDIEMDTACGAHTVAIFLGAKYSKLAYSAMLIATNATVVVLAITFQQVWLCLPLLAVKLGLSLLQDCHADVLAHLPKKTAKYHFIFGALLAIGIAVGY